MSSIHGAALALLATCACAGVSANQKSDLDELKATVQQQQSLLQQQQARIEQLELRLAGLASKAGDKGAVKVQAQPSQPSQPQSPLHNSGEPANMKTIKLEAPVQITNQTVERPQGQSGTQNGRRHLRGNPVERAPRLPAGVELKEPDERAMAELEEQAPQVDKYIAADATADYQYGQAIQALNAGEHLSAQAQFLAFAARFPKHALADNALYYAGLSRGANGDCAGALPLLSRVINEYPAGDAVPLAELEKGRCLLSVGRVAEGKALLQKIMDDREGGSEAMMARALLQQHEAAGN
ncbi:MAG: hypothetical protein JST92_14240 [Deltaproteobacteria bacterium]|nr:hypothetical protein [Deltaproteobacteria bacterium]